MGSGFSSGSVDSGSTSGFSSGSGDTQSSGSGSGSGSSSGDGSGQLEIIEATTTTELIVPSAGEVVEGLRWVDSTVTYQGHHHENIEDCCISCNEDEEVWFVHVQNND